MIKYKGSKYIWYNRPLTDCESVALSTNDKNEVVFNVTSYSHIRKDENWLSLKTIKKSRNKFIEMCKIVESFFVAYNGWIIDEETRTPNFVKLKNPKACRPKIEQRKSDYSWGICYDTKAAAEDAIANMGTFGVMSNFGFPYTKRAKNNDKKTK